MTQRANYIISEKKKPFRKCLKYGDGADVYNITQDNNLKMSSIHLDNRGPLKWLNNAEGRKVPILGDMLFRFYSICPGNLRDRLLRTVIRLEGGNQYSISARRILYAYHDVEVGMYTGLQAAIRGGFPPGTKIGRYSSIDPNVRVFGASHPTNICSSHAFFYNPGLGYAKHDLLERTRPTIGNDVFIGHNAVITNRVASIGDGAYIAAGSIVTKDVPPYALVGGNPARILRYRFSKETIEGLLQERWWEASIDELMNDLRRFQIPLEGDEIV